MEIKWKREIKLMPARLDPVIFSDAELGDVHKWLESKATEYGLRFLLAHADDGVIWGKVLDDGVLKTSNDAAQGTARAENICPPLRLTTLQQARLFGQDAELLLWRDGENLFHSRLIKDVKNGSDSNWENAFDEPQLLWGTQIVPLQHKFTLLEDGAQGLRHAVPINVDSDKLPVQLLVRHYLAQEVFARVVVSRLVDLKTKGE